jgi:glycosyltransferase involved in cell wall biosynthesis
MFSVVVITHNRPEELGRAVRSVVAQTSSPQEILIVDDGSTPPVDVSQLSREAGAIPLRVIRHEVPRGPGAARNAGIAAASQPWVAFLDDDDEFVPDKLAALSLETSAGVNFLYHPARITMVNERLDYVSSPQPLSTDEAAVRRLLVKNVVGGTSMVAATRQLLELAGGFDESLKAFEDYELWIRMAVAGAVFRCLPLPLTKYHHVTRKKSVTKSNEAGLGAFEAIERKHRNAFDSLPADAAREHSVWRYDTLTYRAVLNLDYAETLRCSFATWRRFGMPKHAAMTMAALLGPGFLIRLKAWSANRAGARPTRAAA